MGKEGMKMYPVPVPVYRKGKHEGLLGKMIGKMMQPDGDEKKNPTLKERL